MTKEKFDKTAFKATDKVSFFGDLYRIVQIDFENRLIGIHEFLDDASISFIDSEDLELVVDS